MKYLVHLTSKVEHSLTEGNFRGEPRWERNVLDALLREGEQVHTTLPVWRSSLPKPDNLHDGINPDWLSESVLITHGICRNPHITATAKYYLVQYHEPPDHQTKHLFLDYHQSNPGCIVATTASRHSTTFNQLCSVLGPEKVEWIQGPTIDDTVDDADNFTQPYYTWSYRNFMNLAADDPVGMKRLMNQVKQYLSSDARIVIVLGLWDSGVIKTPDRESAYNWVFSHDFMRGLEDKTDVYINLHHHEVMQILSKTKMIISPPEPLGLPPYEAAKFGIPTIVGDTINPFINEHGQPYFSGLLTAPGRSISKKFLEQLEQLQSNYGFYRSHGNIYRNYVKANATYSAYVNNLKDIMNRRGWN